MRTLWRLITFALVVSVGTSWGCGSRVSSQGVPAPQAANVPPPSELPVVSSVDCQLIPGTAGQGEPIATVALIDRVDPANAPHPTNESERLLFRQLYETLVRIDCDGRAQPGLASSWRLDSGGPTWIVTLRENARFSDDTPVTAAEVIAAWSSNGVSDLRPQAGRLVRSALAVDNRTLAITLTNPRSDTNAPLALAHTDLTIFRRMPGSQWPVGTRNTVVADGGRPGPIGTSITLVDPNNRFSVGFLIASGRDARDLLDGGVDLLLTRDSTVLDYAAALPQFAPVPLAWQRTYVLVTPGRARTAPSLSEEGRQTLASDAIRGEARGAMGPFWWQSLQSCEIAYSQVRSASPSTSGRVVYDGGDGAARDLAERLVGLASASGPGAAAILDALLPGRPRRTYQRAVGLSGDALVTARRRGDDAGYILALDSRPFDACREIQVLVDGMGWIDPETIVPLADTRLKAIVRRGRGGMITEWDGGLLFGDRVR